MKNWVTSNHHTAQKSGLEYFYRFIWMKTCGIYLIYSDPRIGRPEHQDSADHSSAFFKLYHNKGHIL